ncbi:MAG: MotA/TolQ/ExbB proton channel family protein [Planctomycetota bacterium]
MQDLLGRLGEVFLRGGPVMWPLLFLSLGSIALAVERAIFWTSTHRPGRTRWLAQAAEALRRHQGDHAATLAAGDRSLYGEALSALLTKPSPTAITLVEIHRPRFERFGNTLATIVTAAPLLGILGTVLGIIRSFELLSGGETVSDINAVAGGIAEALITTAFGLIVALVTLFPAMVFRAHADRCLGAIEMLAEASGTPSSTSAKNTA